MKKLKALLKSRRGVAIEFAIGVMFITVAVSTILLSTAIHEIKAQQRDNDSFSQKLAAEQYAEEVISNAVDEAYMLSKGMLDTTDMKNLGNENFSHSFSVYDSALRITITAKDYPDAKSLVVDIVCIDEDTAKIKSWTWQP